MPVDRVNSNPYISNRDNRLVQPDDHPDGFLRRLALTVVLAGAAFSGLLGIVVLGYTVLDDDAALMVVLMAYPMLLAVSGIVGWFRWGLGAMCSGMAVICLVILFGPPLDIIDARSTDGVLQIMYGGPAVVALVLQLWGLVVSRATSRS